MPRIGAHLRAFDRLSGLDRLKVMHLNDSKKPCGSRTLRGLLRQRARE